MNDFLLFIDTEASGLPKDWNLPYDVPNNWPYCAQIAWTIYNKSGKLIKEETHYIKNKDFSIEPSATNIHGITEVFLALHGECREEVLKKLVGDVTQYAPLVVGHFMLFDFHMLAADCWRAGIENPVKKEQSYCTMLGSQHLIKNPSIRFLRLDQLYEMLFGRKLENHHNALVDAHATASCFFEMMKRGDINEEIISKQQKEVQQKNESTPKHSCLPVLIIFFLTILISLFV